MTILHIHSEGDSSVGINPSHTEIDLCIDVSDEQEKTIIAQSFLNIFRDLWDAPVTYWYDNEREE